MAREPTSMLNDLRYTVRMLRKSPLFTLAVVLTVALAIGANTAIFSVVNAVMLRPLPYTQPDRLVWIAEKNDKLQLPTFGASVLNYLSWKEQSHAFEPMGAFGFATFALPGRSSSAANERPSTGLMPSSGNSDDVMVPPVSCSGSPAPVRLKVAKPNAPIGSNACDCSFHDR